MISRPRLSCRSTDSRLFDVEDDDLEERLGEERRLGGVAVRRAEVEHLLVQQLHALDLHPGAREPVDHHAGGVHRLEQPLEQEAHDIGIAHQVAAVFQPPHLGRVEQVARHNRRGDDATLAQDERRVGALAGARRAAEPDDLPGQACRSRPDPRLDVRPRAGEDGARLLECRVGGRCWSNSRAWPSVPCSCPWKLPAGRCRGSVYRESGLGPLVCPATGAGARAHLAFRRVIATSSLPPMAVWPTVMPMISNPWLPASCSSFCMVEVLLVASSRYS